MSVCQRVCQALSLSLSLCLLLGLSCESPDQPEESFGPFGPEVSRRVSDRVSPKMGVSEGVSHGVSPGPFGPRAPECQKGVPRVSKRCPDTPGTLSGHLFDTPEPGARRAPETPRGTLPRTPPFSGTPCRTLSGTLRARRARKTLLVVAGLSQSLSCFWDLKTGQSAGLAY